MRVMIPTIFEDYLSTIENQTHQQRVREVLAWVHETFPSLEMRIAWNQPMFVMSGTFIIGFSVAKGHLAVAPESQTIEQFQSCFDRAGYTYGKNLLQIKWHQHIDYELLATIIQTNMREKHGHTKFWR